MKRYMLRQCGTSQSNNVWQGALPALELEKAIALTSAREAGKILLEMRKLPLKIDYKADKSIVCGADLEISKLLTARLLNNFPGYGLLDEENAADNSWRGKEYCWVIDPLDGTIDYTSDGNNFGVLIGLLHESMPILGVAFRPAKNELVSAVNGHGAYISTGSGMHGMHVSMSRSLDLLVGKYRMNNELERIISELRPSRTRLMTTSFKTIEVAKGEANLFISPKSITMNLWDLCAPQAILREAGGMITDVYGKPIDYKGDLITKDGVVASNGLVHDWVLDRLAGYADHVRK